MIVCLKTHMNGQDQNYQGTYDSYTRDQDNTHMIKIHLSRLHTWSRHKWPRPARSGSSLLRHTHDLNQLDWDTQDQEAHDNDQHDHGPTDQDTCDQHPAQAATLIVWSRNCRSQSELANINHPCVLFPQKKRRKTSFFLLLKTTLASFSTWSWNSTRRVGVWRGGNKRGCTFSWWW